MPSHPPGDPPKKAADSRVGEDRQAPGSESRAAKPGPRTILDLFGPQARRFLLTVAIVTLIFVNPWISILKGAIADALFSYAILIPFISVWLIWQQPRSSNGPEGAGTKMGWLLIAAAVACAICGIMARRSGWITSNTSWLTTQMAAWVVAVWGAAFLHLGGAWVRRHWFAMWFLVFTVPIPRPLVGAIEYGLQAASASASDWLFAASGTPYLRDGMSFWLPNLHIEVAPECSGIRSTLVLLITGILGAHMLLKRTVHRLAVVLVIIPLGVLRNAIRILTLTLLSIHVDLEIMNSPLHKKGGPLFFAVSLIPLFLLFWWFGRRERRAGDPR